MDKERTNVIIVGMIILLTLMVIGFGVLAMWIREMKIEIASMELDYKAGDKVLHARVNDINEDLLEVQNEIPEMYMDLSEIRSIIKNTNSALTRTNKQIRKEQKKEEPTTEASPKSSTKEETMHEVFTAEETEVIAQASEPVSDSSPEGMTYLGYYTLTAYEATGNPCANGNMPSTGYTVACNTIPLGSTIYIEGYGTYVVEDTGGMGGGTIDIYMGDVESCYAFGVQGANVYLVN